MLIAIFTIFVFGGAITKVCHSNIHKMGTTMTHMAEGVHIIDAKDGGKDAKLNGEVLRVEPSSEPGHEQSDADEAHEAEHDKHRTREQIG